MGRTMRVVIKSLCFFMLICGCASDFQGTEDLFQHEPILHQHFLPSKSKRGLGSQWMFGGYNPWGAPKPTTTPRPTTAPPIVPEIPNVPTPGGGYGGPKTKCTVRKFDGIYYFGKLNAVAKNVENPNVCVGVCWELMRRGQRCGSVNYLKKQLKCEIMDDQLLTHKVYMFPLLAESDPNAIYIVPDSCDDPDAPPAPPATTTPAPPTEPEGQPPPPGSCGRTMVEPRISNSVLFGRSSVRIVGGSEATPHSFPWIVGLEDWGQHFCGGTLVRVSRTKDESDIVVTASHCLQDKPSYLKLVLGGHHKKRPSAGQKLLGYSKWVMHPKYNRDTVVNDIAIIKLSQPVKFSSTIQPACLPEYGENVQDSVTAIVAGWGSMEEGSFTLPSVLMQVPVIVQNYDLCSTKLYPGEMSAPEMFCAGHLEGGKDSCQGDSGGPLIFKTPKGWMLRGVVSFGDGCARAGKPGVYANVSNYIPWLRETIAQISAVKP